MTKPDIFAPSASGMKEKGNIKSWHKTAWRRKLYKQMNEVSLKANIISSRGMKRSGIPTVKEDQKSSTWKVEHLRG